MTPENINDFLKLDPAAQLNQLVQTYKADTLTPENLKTLLERGVSFEVIYNFQKLITQGLVGLTPHRGNIDIIKGILKNHIIMWGIQQKVIDTAEHLIYKLIDALLYHDQRLGWAHPLCNELKQYIGYLNPELNNANKKAFSDFLKIEETAQRTFFGSYLSDDSDAEAECEQLLHTAPTMRYIHQAQLSEFTYKIRSKRGQFKSFDGIKKSLNALARTEIQHDSQANLVKEKQDLATLNQLLTTMSLTEALKKLKNEQPNFTKFFVAQYRGIHYSIHQWNQPSRRMYRKDDLEIGQTLHSAATINAARIDIYRAYDEDVKKILLKPSINNLFTLSQDEQLKAKKILDEAELHKEILLTLRTLKPYSFENFSYINLAILLQNLYSQDYHAFFKLLSEEPFLKEVFPDHSNPFISTGDIPYHAQKYAHGLKAYNGCKDKILKPKWRFDGRAERPYSGTVYASLHPLEDFGEEGPLHVCSLNYTGEIKMKEELIIMPERESCFPSYLPENRIFYKQDAKYPSFNGPYKSIYLIKYGLDSNAYLQFQTKFKQTAPNSKERNELEEMLGEWLCCFREVKLIDEARKKAEEQGGVLIYRGINGNFSLTPPPYSVHLKRDTILGRQVPEKHKEFVITKKAERATFAHNSPSIRSITSQEIIESLIGSSKITCMQQEANPFVEGNNGQTLGMDLLINALQNKHYRALSHFLQADIFKQEINKTFNTKTLDGATLLHLAILNNDIEATQLLLSIPGINMNALANDSIRNCRNDKSRYFMNLTPLQLAVIEGHEQLVELLLMHPNIKQNSHLMCSYIDNKHRCNEESLPDDKSEKIPKPLEQETKDDPNYYGSFWHDNEEQVVLQVNNHSLMHLAVAQDNPRIVALLLRHKLPYEQINSSNLTPRDITLDKHLTLLMRQEEKRLMHKEESSLAYNFRLFRGKLLPASEHLVVAPSH